MPALASEKRSDVGRPDFHLERTGNTIKRLQHSRCLVLPVLMQIDKSRCYDESPGIDRTRAGQRLRSNAGDVAVGDRDVGYLIEAGFRVEHPAPANDHIVIGAPATHWHAGGQNPDDPSEITHSENAAPYRNTKSKLGR